MSDYNLHTTNTKGPEWFPALAPGVTLDANAKSATMSLAQTAAQITANERVYLGAIPTRGGIYSVAVYDNETAVPADAPANNDFTPNEDVSGASATAGWSRQDANVTPNNLSGALDEAVVDLTDYIRTNGTADYDFALRVNSNGGAPSLVGKRILAVQVVSVGSAAATFVTGYLTLGLNIAGVNYMGSAHQMFDGPAGLTGHTFTDTWYFNPATKKPWTIADVQTFDTTDEVTVRRVSSTTGVRVYQLFMRVITVTENRLATGTLDDSASALTANAWNTVAVLTPTGGAWTKDGAGRHLYMIRRINDTGALVIPQLSDGVTPPNPASGFEPTLDPTYGYATAMGAATPGVFGLVQRTSAPADSVDSQPYALQVEASVYNGQTAQQEISNAAATTYTEHRALVKPNSAAGNLLVKLKRRSDNVQMGATITWTAAEVAALADAGNGWKALDRQGLAALLAAATQYYIEFSDATAADDGTGSGSAKKAWSVLVLDTGDLAGAAPGATAGYGGTTDRGTVNGAEADRYDIATTVANLPATPAAFAAVLADQVLPGDGTDCTVTAFEHPVLTWTATALGASFAQYDIDHSLDAGATWDRVAELPTEATVTWHGYEAPRGVQSCYRIRSVRTDGATSAWSANKCVTPDAQCCEWAFVSQDDPSLNLALSQAGSKIAYKFLDAGDVELLEMYLRDYQVAISGTEERGVTFTVPVLVQAAEANNDGVTVYAALRALQQADTPYVCVLDSRGNRFFADLRVPDGDADTNVAVYLGLVSVTEVSGTPVVDDGP